MASVGPSFITVPHRPPSGPVGSEIGPIVVWLWGEHDVSTDTALCLTLASAIAVGRARVIVDLSGVEFMGASTLGVIARARELLHQGSASLTVRSPSAFDASSACAAWTTSSAPPEKAADVTGRRSAPGWHCRRPTGQIDARAESADKQAETA